MAETPERPNDAAELREALAEVLRRLDQALLKSSQAWQESLRQMVSTGRGISEQELKSALASVQKIQDEFVATVGKMADSAGDRIRPELRGLLDQASRAGGEASKQTAAAMAELTRRLASGSADAALAGMELAGQLGARFTELASGVLGAMADALHKSDSGKKP